MDTQSLNANYISLLNFIKAFEALKTSKSLCLEDCSPLFYVEEIPGYKEYVQINNSLRYSEDPADKGAAEMGQDVLFSVECPEWDPAPKVPNILKEWIEGNPERFEKPVSVRESQNEELFQAVPERVRAFEEWFPRWKLWAEAQKEKTKIRNFFSRLQYIRNSLELYGETLEFVLGNAVIQQKDNSLIHYPLLVKRLLLDFDAKSNVISVCYTEYDTELEQDIFPKLKRINGQGIGEMNFRDDTPLSTVDIKEKIETLLHRLTKDSRIADQQESLRPYDDILVCMTPVFFLRYRPRKVGRMAEQLKNGINGESISINPFLQALLDPSKTSPAGHLENTGGDRMPLAERLARSCGESQDVLLAKPANQQQLEIAEQIAQQAVVVVQGPPGTGKTHTIANLLGHFLSEGKRVLVTSEKGKALKVLKGQMIEPLRSLCVSVTGEASDTVASVQGIMQYVNQHSEGELKRKIRDTEAKRGDCIARLNQAREALFAQRNQQYSVKTYEGQGYSVIDMAKFLREHEKELNYIPGKIQPAETFPLTEEELVAVYKSNRLISTEDERDMKDLPDLGNLMVPADVEKLLVRREAAEMALHQLQCSFRYDALQKILYSPEDQVLLQVRSDEQMLQLEQEIQDFNQAGQLQPWMLQCIMDCRKGGSYKESWEKFTQVIQEIVQFFDQYCVEASHHSISAAESLAELPNALSMLRECGDVIQADGSLPFFFRIGHRKHKEVLQSVEIDGHPPKSKEDVQLIWEWLTFLEQLQRLAPAWKRMSDTDGTVPDLGTLKNGGPGVLIGILKRFTKALSACVELAGTYGRLLQYAAEAGFVLPQESTIWTSEMTLLTERIHFLQQTAPYCIACWKQLREKAFIEVALSDLLQQIQTIPSQIPAMKVLQDAVNQLQNGNDADAMRQYEETYEKIRQLHAKQNVLAERSRILSLLRKAAPGWAAAMETRAGDFGKNVPQETIRDAWKWKVFDVWIREINAAPLDEMQERTEALAEQLRTYTGELCEYKAWLYVAERVHSDGKLRMDLQIWQNSIKLLGKGTGKSAGRYRQQARAAMAECQYAVPVWIMPFTSALDMFDPEKNHFDILIVDEASQSDLTSLVVLGMAEKVIIVGDDKQVSPSSIGITDDDVEKLKQQCLPPRLALSGLLNAKTSLYDLAAGSADPIELIEHFRCVPDIIGYSNNLAYNHAIKPLRPASDTNLHPAVIPFRVQNGKRERNKTNSAEARTIAALIKACCQNAAYKGKTMGVISLLSGGQADRIENEISAILPLQEIEERRILCGEAAQFQGDERDVIFLSMVDSPNANGPLEYRSPERNVYQQRYNVAVSRAKDQLWVIHSLDKNTDLKNGPDGYDIRRGLLEYAENPAAYNDEQKIEHFAESPFEKEVCRYLQQEGFHFEQQWKAGAYRIDIVVLYGSDRVAIECDGMRFHGTAEQIQEDMERQTILERLGWRFIRIRGTEFYRDKEGTMRRVYQRLAELGIQRESVSPDASSQDTSVIQSIETMAARILADGGTDGDVDLETAEPAATGRETEEKKPREKNISSLPLADKSVSDRSKKGKSEGSDSFQGESSLFSTHPLENPSLFSLYTSASAKEEKHSTRKVVAESVNTYGAGEKEKTVQGETFSEKETEAGQSLSAGTDCFIRTVDIGSGYKLKVAKDASKSIIVDKKRGKYYECKPGLRLVRYFMGLGTVTKIEGGDITLEFPRGKRTFKFPEDLQAGRLSFRIMDNRDLAKDYPVSEKDLKRQVSASMSQEDVAVPEAARADRYWEGNSATGDEGTFPARYVKVISLSDRYTLQIGANPEESVIIDKERNNVYECKPGLILRHNVQGKGVIKSITKDSIILSFQNGNLSFDFPKVLQEGDLKFEWKDNQIMRKKFNGELRK